MSKQQALDLIRQARALASGARALVRPMQSVEDEHGYEPHAYAIHKTGDLLEGVDRSLADAYDYLTDAVLEEDPDV